MAARFSKAHHIALRFGDHDSAMNYLIRAAWVYDDLGDTLKASYLRSLALLQADLALSDEPEDKVTLMLIREDLLRRSGRFEALIEEYSGITFDDPMYELINAFQIEKAKEGDRGFYTLSDAVPEEDDDPDDPDDGVSAEDNDDLPEWLSMWTASLDPGISCIDHDYLENIGISFDNREEEARFLGFVNDDLQVRIGERISSVMPKELLAEFDLIDDPYEAVRFLEENCPDHQSISARCVLEITRELIRYREMITGADVTEEPPLMEMDISQLGLEDRIVSLLKADGVDTLGDIMMTDLPGHNDLLHV